MKRLLSFTGILIIAGLMQGCAVQGESHEQMVDAVKQLDQNFMAAFSKGDVDGVMDCYWKSPELVVYPPGEMEAKGWDAARECIGHAVKHMAGAKLEIVEPQYMPAGEAVIGWGTWKASFPKGPDAMPDMLGRYTEVAMKKDGKWVIVLDHASAPLPPPPGK